MGRQRNSNPSNNTMGNRMARNSKNHPSIAGGKMFGYFKIYNVTGYNMQNQITVRGQVGALSLHGAKKVAEKAYGNCAIWKITPKKQSGMEITFPIGYTKEDGSF